MIVYIFRKYDLVASLVVGIIIICFQMYGQKMLINLNFAHPQVNSVFIKKNPILRLTRWPSYTLKNSYEVMNLVNQRSYNTDYYPYKSRSEQNDVINNRVNGHNYDFKRTGYNCFTFKLPRFQKHVVLPLLIYNHEYLGLRLNHYCIHKLTNQNGLIEISNVHSGVNKIRVSNESLFSN